MRAIEGRTALTIGLGIGGALLLLFAGEVFVAGVSAENGVGGINRGLIPADIIWIISMVCFVIALVIYGTTPEPQSDE